jgi:hypothetical protein
MKKYRLLKPLPGCPSGRIFKQDLGGDYFHSMTDEEAIHSNFKMYVFTKYEVEGNPDFFEEFDGENFHAKLYNPNDINEYKLVDTGIPNVLFEKISKLLDDESTNYSLSPFTLIELDNISWVVVHKDSRKIDKKYKITIEKI